MFSSCSNLTSAPELPATNLTAACYENMFYNCSRLNYIKCLATTNIDTDNWVSGVAGSGTFVKNASINNWPTGNNGIPANWTVQDV
jgi:hypothetical protein